LRSRLGPVAATDAAAAQPRVLGDLRGDGVVRGFAVAGWRRPPAALAAAGKSALPGPGQRDSAGMGPPVSTLG
jgi:hypothetical protein